MNPPLQPYQILHRVCSYYGVTVGELEAKDAHKTIAKARRVAAWLLRKSGKSYDETGTVLHRHHTSIIFLCKTVERDRSSDASFARELEYLAKGIA